MQKNYYRNRLKNHIRRCSLNNSFERFEILHAIESFCQINSSGDRGGMNPEFSADDIFKLLKEKLGIFTKSTVYRAFSLMLEAGIIVETNSKRGRKFYKLIQCDECPGHLHCIKCGEVTAISEPLLDNLISEICGRKNFEKTSMHICIKGICEECREKEKTE